MPANSGHTWPRVTMWLFVSDFLGNLCLKHCILVSHKLGLGNTGGQHVPVRNGCATGRGRRGGGARPASGPLSWGRSF